MVDINILIVLGGAIFFGIIGGKIFQYLRIPQVVGYIVLGLILGKSCFHIFEGNIAVSLQPLVNFTLGIIGCIIGAELKLSVFKEHGKSIYAILIGEGLLTFLLVAAAVTILTQKLYLGLILGAIASATDPASTMNVLWEYRAKGPLTRTLTSVVALDDCLALTLYGLVSVFAKTMIADQEFSLLEGLLHPLAEIVQCLFLGFIGGLIVAKVSKVIKDEALVISSILGVVAIGVGLSMRFNLDLILSSMAFGATLANLLPKRSDHLFAMIRNMTTPLYILFFISVGAKLDFRVFFNVFIIGIVVCYVCFRSAGKVLGAALGGMIAKVEPVVIKYAGWGLFSQAGVAMGLALSINHSLGQVGVEGREIGNLIVNVVAATTFIVQIIGPGCVKWAIFKAKENDRNLTEEDLIRAICVEEVVDTSYPLVKEKMPLKQVLSIFSESPYTQYPVINENGKLTGVINIESIKNALFLGDIESSLLADDLKSVYGFSIPNHVTLFHAKQYMDKYNLGFVPVVDRDHKIIGCFDRRRYKKYLSTRLLQMQNAV